MNHFEIPKNLALIAKRADLENNAKIHILFTHRSASFSFYFWPFFNIGTACYPAAASSQKKFQ